MAAMFCGCGIMISVLSITHHFILHVSVSPRSHKAEGGAGLGHRRLRVSSEGGAPLWRSAEWGPTWHHHLQRRDRHLGWGPARRTLHITTGAVAAWSHTHCKCVSEVGLNDMDKISYLDIHVRYLNIDTIWYDYRFGENQAFFRKIKRLF